MEELKIGKQQKDILNKFVQGLKDIYGEELLSVILYGSAASGEFVDRYSNLNLLVVLKNTEMATLKKAARLTRKFNRINPLFLSEEYIAGSTDIFPVEFLDMQENYFLLYGKDALKDIRVDTRNLRFQCEQELKARLLKLRQGYLALSDNTAALRDLLFASFTSVVHIARNLLRIKGIKPPYIKSEVLEKLSAEFKIDTDIFKKILSTKNKQVKLAVKETERLFIGFVKGVELLVNVADKL